MLPIMAWMVVWLMAACTPHVKVDQEKAIKVDVNVKVDHDVRIKMERDPEKLQSKTEPEH